uniref:Pyridine nucleotide-disulfide oxidoreductase, class I n=1 Tax=uncultured organism TaxID=155900 RepID=M1QBL0_9ZZZZ|nr:pyridine nucleotide-disulfide oxidoreductase, class I [uncultured organism]
MRIIIIGGVAAGTSAAAKAKRENSDSEIILFEKGKDISYAGCGLPYYISGITSRDQIVINTPEEFQKKYNIEVKTSHKVTKILPDSKQIIYENQKKSNKIKYDKLIIATGASPIIPPIPGINLNHILPLRTLKNAVNIKNIIENKNPQNITIVGAGLIGLEMAEAFYELNLNITIIEKMSQVLPTFSRDMAQIVKNHLLDKNIDLYLNEEVTEFVGDKNNNLKSVKTKSGKNIDSDLTLISTGIKPNTDLASQAGVKTGNSGAVAVNEKMETSIPDIFAAGDCAQSTNLITNKPVWFPLGSTANKQGRIAGENAAGGSNNHKGILKTAITKIFDLTVAKTGISVEEAEKNEIDPVTTKITAANHAGYYPELEKINLKGVFNKDNGEIIGAEIIGKDGVDKRIDVLSTAIYSKLTAHDLFQVDLAYAPPYSSPKDPAAILGMVTSKKL